MLAELIERAETLCRRVAPADLAGLPIYVIAQSELPAELGGAACRHAGYTSRALDLFLRCHLEDRWQGRGPCFVVNDSYLRDRYPADLVAEAFLGISLHELAHVLADFLPLAPIEAVSMVAVVAAGVLNVQEGEAAVVDWEQCRREQVRTHGPRFLRAALHLQHRAQLAGSDLTPWQVVGCLPTSLPCAYAEALGPEPAELADFSISAVLERPLPAEFAALWQRDLATFEERERT